MLLNISLYKDEFNTHKEINKLILEETLRRLPNEDPRYESAELNEERSMMFDTLFEEVAVKVDEFLKADLQRTLNITFNPETNAVEVSDLNGVEKNVGKVSIHKHVLVIYAAQLARRALFLLEQPERGEAVKRYLKQILRVLDGEK